VLKPGERALIISEFDTDPLVVSSFATACSEFGGEVAIMTIPPISLGGWDASNPSELVVAACEKANLIIACTYFEFAHSERTFYHTFFGKNTRICSIAMAASVGCLIAGGRFPLPLYFEISNRVRDMLNDFKTITFTTSSGTHIAFKAKRALVHSRPLEAANWDVFPPIGINFLAKNTNGTCVFDESTITGKPSSPIKLTIEKNFVTKIEGGSEAERNTLESFANGRYFVRHAVIGLHPKVRTINAPQFERARAAGSAYIGFDGTGPAGQIDRRGAGLSHLDCIFDTPTVTCDDKVIIRDRRLLVLEDKELVEIAKKHGDPIKILSQTPYL